MYKVMHTHTMSGTQLAGSHKQLTWTLFKQLAWSLLLYSALFTLLGSSNLCLGLYSSDPDSPIGYRLENRYQYLAVAPKTVRPNEAYLVAFTLYHEPNHPIMITAMLSRDGEQYAHGEHLFSHKGTTNIEVKVPDIVQNGDHKLRIEGLVNNQPIFTNSTELRFQAKHVSLFIQTDKPVYYPHDQHHENQADVYFKVIGATPSLQSVSGEMTIYVKDGRGFVVRRWIQKQLNMGFYTDFFRIPYPVNVGTWTIQVEAFGEWYEQTFLVKFWYRRRFYVTVNTPLRMFTSEWGLTGTVKSEHSSNKYTEGSCTVSLRIREKDGDFIPGELEYKIPYMNGLASFEFSMDRINATFGTELGGKQMYVKAWVYDFFWQDTMNGSAITDLYDPGVRVNILGKAIRTFKPGVPFEIVLVVEQTDGSPYSSFLNRQVEIQIFYYGDLTRETYEKLIIPDDSIIKYTVDSSISDTRIIIRAWPALTKTTTEVDCYPYWSEKGKYLAITTSTLNPRVDTYAVFTINTNFYTDAVNYVVMGHGRLLAGGMLEMTSQQTTFSLALSRDMSPEVRVVVYCMVDGVVLNDALTMYVNDTRLYRLDIQVNKGKDFRGDVVEIVGVGIPGSLISTHGHHRDFYLRGGKTFLTDEKIINDLLKYNHGADVDAPHQHIWYYDDERWDGSKFFTNPTTGVDHMTTFNVSGLVVLSDTNLTVTPESHHCNATLGFGRCLNGDCFELSRLCDGIVDCDIDAYDEMACPNQPVPESRPNVLNDLHLVKNYWTNTMWVWNISYIKPYGRSEVSVHVPNINVEFMIGGTSIHPEEGLSIFNLPLRYDLTRAFWMTIEAPGIIQRGEQVGIRCAIFNNWDQDIEAIVILHGGPDHKFVVVEEFGIVNSYAPRTISGDVQVMISIDAHDSVYVHFPILSRLGRGAFDVSVSSHSILRTDMQTLPFEIWYDGFEQDDHIPYLIDLVNTGSIIVPDFEIPTPEQFYRPGQRELLYVPGSALGVMHLWGNVAIAHNMMEPLRVERTVGLPYDSADGYISEFALNLITLEYFKQINDLNVTEEFKSVEYLKRFLTKISAYMDDDGSVKMFRRTNHPCLWLSSIVLRYLHRAHTTEWDEFLGIDGQTLNSIALWITEQFNPRRMRFEEPSDVFYDRNMGPWTVDVDGIERLWHIATNAHVVTTLALANRLTGDAKSAAEATSTAAAEYLAQKMTQVGDPYSMAMLAYALHKFGHTDKDHAFWILKDMQRDQTEYVYWAADEILPNPQKIVDTRTYLLPRDDWPNQANAVIATSLALILHLDRNELADSVPIMKWLQTQRCDKLVWASTQDSLVAYTALIEYAYRETNREFYNMEVTLEATKPMDPAWHHVVQLNMSNFANMYVYRMEDAWGEIRVSARGTGYAYLHFTEFYNLEHSHQLGNPPYPTFNLDFEDQLAYGRNSSYINQTICLQYNNPELAEAAGMTVLILVLPTGFVISRDVIERMHQDTNLTGHGFIRLRVRNEMVNIFFEYVTPDRFCFDLMLERWYPVANISHTHMAMVNEYSETGLQNNSIWTTYSLFNNHICAVCGSFQCPYCPFYNTAPVGTASHGLLALLAATAPLIITHLRTIWS